MLEKRGKHEFLCKLNILKYIVTRNNNQLTFIFFLKKKETTNIIKKAINK